MTDAEIIKALECCKSSDTDCVNCPFDFGCMGANYESLLSENALALINRQKAEIERLKNAGDNKTKELLRLNSTIEELHKKIKTATIEAIKEFAFDLTEEVKQIDMTKPHEDKYDIRIHVYDIIDNLVKEMEGKKDV